MYQFRTTLPDFVRPRFVRFLGTTSLTSAMGLFAVATGILTVPNAAQAACTVDGGAAGTGIVTVPSGSSVVCSGTTNDISLDGRPAGATNSSVEAVGFDMALEPGAKLSSTLPNPSGKGQEPPIIRAGSGSSIAIRPNSTVDGTKGDREAIVIDGTNGKLAVTRGARVLSGEEAIAGTRTDADGWIILNDGTIETRGISNDATLRSGDNATVENTGMIDRRFTVDLGSQRSINRPETVNIGRGSRLINEQSGTIQQWLRPADGNRAGSVVVVGTGSTFENKGLIHIQGNDSGSALSFSNGDNAEFINRKSGELNARNGAAAIGGAGDDIKITN